MSAEGSVITMSKEDDPVVVRMLERYQAGDPIEDILREAGRSRTTLYYHLRRNGIARERMSHDGTGGSSDALLRRIEDLVAENVGLRERAERAERMLEKMIERNN